MRLAVIGARHQMIQNLGRLIFENCCQRLAITANPRSICFGDKFQFCIGVDRRLDVIGLGQLGDDALDHVKLVGIDVKRLDTLRGLQGICRIDHNNPVAVTEQGQLCGKLRAPRVVGEGLSNDNEC